MTENNDFYKFGAAVEAMKRAMQLAAISYNNGARDFLTAIDINERVDMWTEHGKKSKIGPQSAAKKRRKL